MIRDNNIHIISIREYFELLKYINNYNINLYNNCKIINKYGKVVLNIISNEIEKPSKILQNSLIELI
jgi:hypothetical protein